MEKDPQKPEAQSEIERTKVEEDLYVNAATLELLQRRLEASIKNAFWRWLGLPIGGVSVVAIIALIWTLPGYVDKHVGTIISNLPQFQQTVQIQTESYLKDKDKGGRLIETFVAKSALPHIDSAVTNHLKEPEREKQIRALVVEYMKSGRGREQLGTAIDRAVKPLSAELSYNLEYRLNMYLKEVETALIFPERSPEISSTEIIEKGTLGELRRFLENSAPQLKERGRPVFLKISRTGNYWYMKSLIRAYVKKFREFFGTQFEAVLIEGEQREFLGLIPLPEFEQVIADDSRTDPFVHWLNRRSVGQLTQWFDPKVTKYASTTKNVIKLLSANESWRSRAANEPIAVLDSAGHFLGITSRNKILDQLVVSMLSAVG